MRSPSTSTDTRHKIRACQTRDGRGSRRSVRCFYGSLSGLLSCLLWQTDLDFGVPMRRRTCPGELCTISGLHGQAQLVLAKGDNPALALISTAAETLFGILLIAGLKTRITALLSGVLLAMFALSMTIALGVKAPLNLSVFSAAAGALLLATYTDFRYSMDELLRRSTPAA